CLARNGLTRDDIDHFVFHQASRYLLETLADRLGLPPEKVPIVMEDTGNTVSSSIPCALSILRQRGRLAGTRVLVAGFGVGLSWASNVLTFPAADGPAPIA
ncbi:MAG TPA: 3-oxoacyl-[acyl-carrier-protein] synthase III C-terminal domain-containing protein, partial [Azospirillum sp.]